jgi:hypothetical protein
MNIMDDRLSACRMSRGVCRALSALGYATNGRRVDVIGVNGGGETAIVEIKPRTADYRADRK